MTKRSFLIWENVYVTDSVVLSGSPEGVEKNYELSKGKSRKSGWPKKAIFHLHKDYPKALKLTDSLFGGSGLKVISKQLKDFLVMAKVPDIEFLPVQIYDVKNNLLSKDYFIANPLLVVDCIDVEASKIVWNTINPKILDSCKKMALKDSEIPDNAQMFRPEYAKFVILIAADLVKEMKAKYTGITFSDPLDFKGA